MSKTSRQPSPPPSTRLMLFAPPLGAVDTVARLTAALSAGPVAAVVLPLAEPEGSAAARTIKSLVPIVQEAGAALLIFGSVETALRGGADGTHLIYRDGVVVKAADRLHPQRILGVGGLTSRDDAMAAGEAGADYVMFGEPDDAGRTLPFAAVVERVGWWAELFEVPVVGYAPGLSDIPALVAARADFVAVGAAVFEDPRGPAEAAREAFAALGAPLGASP